MFFHVPNHSKYEVNVVLARLGQQRVEEREVELAFLRLDLFPGDRNLDRVGMQLSIAGQTSGSTAG